MGLLLSLAYVNGGLGNKASAANGESRIVDIVGKNTFLLDNGTLWSQMDGYRMIRTPGNLTSIDGSDDYRGTALSADGQLMEWDTGTGPRPVAGQTGVKQIAGGYSLKTDGTVWAGTSKVKGLEGIAMIG